MPTISECACCDIIRMSCVRYRSGIQSLGSIVSPRGDARLELGDPRRIFGRSVL